ncbi:hypothetical protein LOK49_LG02G00101 [Camellia lanceoleosa]|uniref:Uncharacterized protein n=1 Tax=Camellia lanceoleosa TaxID=1840588 RepID=A0ACC0IKW1_9ERIC|nr:hypothetical protein LOK49_LG02G00101 [Camellia lanceoleosa]
MWWVLKGFSVRSFYRCLVGEVGGVFPWRSIWLSRIPSKVAFFLWTAALGRNLTIDNLVRRGHVLVNQCCMCYVDAETVDHLFLHCSLASRLWGSVCSLFGIPWVQPKGVVDMLWSWRGARVGRSRRRVWLLVPSCLLWLVWLERNRRIFQGLQRSVLWLEDRFLVTLYSWLQCKVDPDIFSFLDFLDDVLG